VVKIVCQKVAFSGELSLTAHEMLVFQTGNKKLKTCRCTNKHLYLARRQRTEKIQRDNVRTTLQMYKLGTIWYF